MHGPGEIFAADPAIKTLVHVTNIGATDTAFTVAVYTRDQFNGKKALEALNDAITEILDHWNTVWQQYRDDDHRWRLDPQTEAIRRRHGVRHEHRRQDLVDSKWHNDAPDHK